MDKLEKQIIENRSDLDRLIPGPEIWQHIQYGQNKIRSQKIRRISGWAALIIVIVTSSILFFQAGHTSSDNLPDDLSETESYYSAKFNNLIDQATPILINYPGLSEDLMMELDNLDRLYVDIKKDLKDNVCNREVIDALILNYKAKIQILEEMLTILNEENTNDENKASYEI